MMYSRIYYYKDIHHSHCTGLKQDGVVGMGGFLGVVDMAISTQSTLHVSACSGGCQVLGLSPGPLPRHRH